MGFIEKPNGDFGLKNYWLRTFAIFAEKVVIDHNFVDIISQLVIFG